MDVDGDCHESCVSQAHCHVSCGFTELDLFVILARAGEESSARSHNDAHGSNR